jgi:hypothetical protein
VLHFLHNSVTMAGALCQHQKNVEIGGFQNGAHMSKVIIRDLMIRRTTARMVSNRRDARRTCGAERVLCGVKGGGGADGDMGARMVDRMNG